MNRKHESTIGALGSRWGIASEVSFCNALQGILEQSFGVQVLNLNLFDQEGEVFGRPDQVEIDLIKLFPDLPFFADFLGSADGTAVAPTKRRSPLTCRRLFVVPLRPGHNKTESKPM